MHISHNQMLFGVFSSSDIFTKKKSNVPYSNFFKIQRKKSLLFKIFNFVFHDGILSLLNRPTGIYFY